MRLKAMQSQLVACISFHNPAWARAYANAKHESAETPTQPSTTANSEEC
jgi:hypothetical protein